MYNSREEGVSVSDGHHIEAYFDGACEPLNPGGHGAWGIRICVDGKEVHVGGGYVGSGDGISNNVAEYAGVVAIMQWVLQSGFQGSLKVRGDSNLVINQLSGRWKVKRGLYVERYREALALLQKAKETFAVEFEWIPREQNSVCDYHSKKVLRDRGVKFRLQAEAP